MNLLDKREYYKLERFKHIIDSQVYNSIIIGDVNGKIYVNDNENPSHFVVWYNNSMFLFIYGDFTQNKELSTSLLNCLKNNLLPQYRGLNLDAVIVQTTRNNASICYECLKSLNSIKHYRLSFEFDKQLYLKKIKNWQNRVPDEIEIRKLDAAYFNEFCAEPVNEKIINIWGKSNFFLSKSFGYTVITNKKPVSWCFGTDSKPEIQINTNEEYQGKGYATYAAAAFLDECIDRNLNPYWECCKTNTKSIALAEKLCFKIKEEFYHIIINLKK